MLKSRLLDKTSECLSLLKNIQHIHMKTENMFRKKLLAHYLTSGRCMHLIHAPE